MTQSYRLTIGDLGELAVPGRFWDVLQTRARLVDSLPCNCGEAFESIRGFLPEWNVHLPPGDQTEEGLEIQPPAGTQVITCLTRHEAQVLRSRLEKRGLDRKGGNVIGESFGYRDEASRNAIQQCLDLLARQAAHFQYDDERVLVVVTAESS